MASGAAPTLPALGTLREAEPALWAWLVALLSVCFAAPLFTALALVLGRHGPQWRSLFPRVATLGQTTSESIQ